jgi:Dolichyl-phosphate-mannose-protein mannosyltransferase
VRLGRGYALLAGLVLISAALRAWAGRAVTTPWISPDEPAYALLGRSLYAAGRLRVLNGPTGFLSATAPALFGLPMSVANLELGYSVAKVVDACVMSLAAVPAYLWARTLVSRNWALAAAALTLALPGLAYSGLLMTEVLFYPLVVCTAWSLASAIECPTLRRQLLFVALLAVAVLTRTQAVVLVAAFVGAVSLECVLARRMRLRVFAPSAIAIVALSLIRAVAIAVTGGSTLGGYEGADRGYPLGPALRYVLYHAGDLVLLSAFVPFCAVGVLLVGAVARGEGDPRLRAYLSVAAAVVCAFVVEVGVFASQNVHHLAERDLIALAPLLFIGFVVWLDRGDAGPATRGAVAAAAVALVLVIPLGSFVTAPTLVDGFSLIPLYDLRGLTSLGVTYGALAAGVVAAAAIFVLVPRRYVLVLPIIVGAALVGGSVAASRQVVTESNLQRAVYSGPVRRWVDNVATAPTYYLYDQQTPTNTAWQTLFWNRSITRVYDLPPSLLSGPAPQQVVSIAPSGLVRTLAGSTLRPAYAVVSQRYALAGSAVAYSPRNADRSGYAVWKVEPPLRIDSEASGLAPNGDLPPGAVGRLDAYGCTSGTFRLTLLVKQPGLVRIALDDREIRRRSFPGPTEWDVTIPVANGPQRCRLTVRGTGLLGTTRLEFDPT